MNQDNMSREDQQVQEMDRLLRRYATDVFDPSEEDLGDVSDEQVDALMRKTFFIRRLRAKSPLFTVRRMAVAAMLMICCGFFATIVLQPRDHVSNMPSVTRAGKYEVKVCAPNGATHSRTPDIVITGDANATYKVSVKNMDGKLIVPEIEVNGGATLQGSKCFAQPLEEDEVYSIVVRRDGITVNDVGESVFWIED